jgi:hypothetical protein
MSAIKEVKWFESKKGIRFRCLPLSPEKICVCITKKFYDLSFGLGVRDFLDRCRDEESLNIEVNNTWIIPGFSIPEDDLDFFINYVETFIAEWDVKPLPTAEKISSKMWYET